MKTSWCRAAVAAASGLLLAAGSAVADDAQIREIERSLWEGWAKNDMATFEKNLAPNVVNMTVGGLIVGKAELMEGFTAAPCDVKSYALGDMQVVRPAANVAIVVYTATQDASCSGGEYVPPPKVSVTSVFVEQGGQWLAASYSETPTD